MNASSVVIRGIDARTFSEMESFVKDLEARPIERLLKDLSQLADLPMTTTGKVIRRELRQRARQERTGTG